MLNKDNYVPWYSRLLCYAKSRPNGKLIYNSIINGPYVRRMISEPGDPDRDVPIAKNFHEQTDDKLTDKETSMIAGYARKGQSNKAIGLFLDMKKERVKPDTFTVTSMNLGQDRHMQMVGGNGGNQFE
ncbi:retrovirus-related pol polyprotein from transposon TNT 1-94, partial [Tanacetum coccineum]